MTRIDRKTVRGTRGPFAFETEIWDMGGGSIVGVSTVKLRWVGKKIRQFQPEKMSRDHAEHLVDTYKVIDE